MLLNNLSGEGLFDERPTTQTSLGRFVLWPPEARPSAQKAINTMNRLRRVLAVTLFLGVAAGAQNSAPSIAQNPPAQHSTRLFPAEFWIRPSGSLTREELREILPA